MQFQDNHIYDESLSRIEAMYFDAEFCPRKYAELGLADIRVLSAGHDGHEFHVSCHFLMEPSLPLPGFARKFLGGGVVAVTQTDRWNTATRQGQLEFHLEKHPIIKIAAQMSLEEHERGTINRMDWTVECKVPVVGGKLAELLAKDIQSKSAADLDASVQVMNRHY